MKMKVNKLSFSLPSRSLSYGKQCTNSYQLILNTYLYANGKVRPLIKAYKKFIYSVSK